MKNIEIKAKTSKEQNLKIKKKLRDLNAIFLGSDYQTDIYFEVPQGRLKLRKGNIENSLIFYKRKNKAGPKKSEILLYKTKSNDLEKILLAALNKKNTVKKNREIYFVQNIKIHLDYLEELGYFAEIEVIDQTDTLAENELRKKCENLMQILDIHQEQLIELSYSDLLEKIKQKDRQ